MMPISYNTNDYKDLEGVIKVYSEEKCLEWLEMRGWGDQTSDYDWIIQCAKWEVALYGKIRYEGKQYEGKGFERKNLKIAR